RNGSARYPIARIRSTSDEHKSTSSLTIATEGIVTRDNPCQVHKITRTQWQTHPIFPNRCPAAGFVELGELARESGEACIASLLKEDALRTGHGAMRDDTMLLVGSAYNLSVVMPLPIPWYGFFRAPLAVGDVDQRFVGKIEQVAITGVQRQPRRLVTFG